MRKEACAGEAKGYFQEVTGKDHRLTAPARFSGGFALLFSALLLLFAIGAEPARAQTRKPPYWASISANEARMRVGPSLDYPSNWVYRRRDLPVRVTQVHGNWRKIADESGTQGWMHVRLLSDTRTAIVSVPQGRLYKKPDDRSQLLFRAEKGVVGRLGDCGGDWCLLDIGGKKGYIRASSLWGATRQD